MTSSPTLPNEWAGGGSGSAGSIPVSVADMWRSKRQSSVSIREKRKLGFPPPPGLDKLIEPAEPEPPPAHSLGRVDEDVMGRSGQLVRSRSLDVGDVAGGVAGGEDLVVRLVVRLVVLLLF